MRFHRQRCQKLLVDITYISYNSVLAYLFTDLDAYTRQILSYMLSESLEVEFVLGTIVLLIEKNGMSLDTETLIHSDQGCHYTSYQFIQFM